MSFWSELGQRISRGSQDAIQKTKDVASTLSLRADISDAQSHIMELQAQIGKAVIDSQFEGLDKEALREIIDGDQSEVKIMAFSEWKQIWEKVMMIRADEELIEMDLQKIAELDDKIKCPGCGNLIQKGSAFCPDCGTKIIYPAPAKEEGTVREDTVEFKPSAEEKPSEDTSEPESEKES